MRVFVFILSAGVLSTLNACINNQSPKGKVADSGIPVEHIEPTADQQRRRVQSEEYCKSHSIPVYGNPNALFTDPEADVIIRSKDEVVDRALALCYIALKGEGLEQNYLDKMDREYNIMAKLTAEEKAFARNRHPEEQEKVDATWRYESLHLLLWALSFADTLSYPDQPCDVVSDAKIMRALSEQQFREKAKLRSKKEILDQADLILRLDWACVDARVNKRTIPGKMHTGVVYERHYSLNWLIHYLDLGWDDVTTDT
ncbi:MAG: DUF4272 domain-containing protein [Chitinophagaceae bacterium]